MSLKDDRGSLQVSSLLVRRRRQSSREQRDGIHHSRCGRHPSRHERKETRERIEGVGSGPEMMEAEL